MNLGLLQQVANYFSLMSNILHAHNLAVGFALFSANKDVNEIVPLLVG